jgi:large subunit ribosomal protein L9
MMDVILLQTVENLGKLGETVSVARGYARNYLVPKGLAVEASEGARKMVADKLVLEAKRDHKRKEAAELLAKELVAKGLAVTLTARVGEEDKLYGSVSARDIAGALAEHKSLEIDHQQLVLPEPIKEVGEFEVPLKLHHDVEISVTVTVQAAE